MHHGLVFGWGGDAFIPGGDCIVWRLGELGGFHCLFLYTLSLYLFFCVFLFPPLSLLALYNHFFGWLAFVGDGMFDFLVSGFSNTCFAAEHSSHHHRYRHYRGCRHVGQQEMIVGIRSHLRYFFEIGVWVWEGGT